MTSPGSRTPLSRGVSLQNLGRAFTGQAPPPPPEVRTRDIYGFEIDGKRSKSYRAFYEKFLLHTQQQSVVVNNALDAGLFKNWVCPYAKGSVSLTKSLPENADFDRVAAIVRDGLPLKTRGEIWLYLTGVAAKVKIYPGVYESLLEPYDPSQSEQNGIHSSPSTIQIEKDVPRTFPGYVWTPKGKKFQPALRRLLRAYAMRNPKLGYCQSMNFIAGGLLLFLEEVEAFWMLCFIVEELLPDYFSKDIIGTQIDAEVLTLLMVEHTPDIWNHFEASGVNTVLVSTQWFMCLFIRTLPFECAFRVWDYLFLYGPQVLFEVGLAILKMHQPELLAFEDTIDIVSHLTSSLSDMFDCSRIWEVPVTRIDHKKIAMLRETSKEKVLRNFRMKADILDLMDAIPHSKFSRETLEELYVQYANLSPSLNDIDVVEKGLSKSVFQKVIVRMCNWQFEQYFLDRLFFFFDLNRNNRVDFKELIAGLSVLIKGTYEEKIKMCFFLFDKNSDGFVDREEFRAMLTALYTVCNTPRQKTKPKRNAQSAQLSQSSTVPQTNTLVKSSDAVSIITTTPDLAQEDKLMQGGSQTLIGAELQTKPTRRLAQSCTALSVPSAQPPSLPRSGSPTPSSGRLSPSFRPKLTLSPSMIRKPTPFKPPSTPSSPPSPPSPVIISFDNSTTNSTTNSLKLSDSPPSLSKQIHSGTTQQLAQESSADQTQAQVATQDPKRLSVPTPEPAHTKTPAPALSLEPEPETQQKDSYDYVSEVAFFVDMLFAKADVTKDDRLSPDEFKEAAQLHPDILKTFNLDHQHKLEVRISIA